MKNLSKMDKNGSREQDKVTYVTKFQDEIQKLKEGSKTVPKSKKPANTEEQLESLQKLCEAPDADKRYSNKNFRKRKLAEITYFRLKGYAVTLQEVRENVGCKDGISFETVCRVYECDAQLRALLLEIFSKIEVSLRSQLSNFDAQEHGRYGYLDKRFYNYPESDKSAQKPDKKKDKSAQKPDKKKGKKTHNDFLDWLIETEERESSKEMKEGTDKKAKVRSFVDYYLKRYKGIMPIWAVSELMSFGELVRFYQNWKEDDRIKFLSEVMYKGHDEKIDRATYKSKKRRRERFISWLENCRNLRNVCAHCGRLYGRRFPWTTNLPPEIPQPSEAVLPLWGSILAAEFLYPDETDWKTSVVPRLNKILCSAKADYYLLRVGLGFPPDWEKQLEIWWNL